MTIADSGDAILMPAESPGARVIVREILPGIAERTVVLADRSPGALTEVGTPTLPVRPLVARLFEPEPLCSHKFFLSVNTEKPRLERFIPEFSLRFECSELGNCIVRAARDERRAAVQSGVDWLLIYFLGMRGTAGRLNS